MLAGLLLFIAVPVVAQTNDDEATRKLWDTDFLQKRPAAPKTSAARPPITYKRVARRAPGGATADGSVLGITIWRLRPAKPSDEARILVPRRDKKTAQFTPERVASEVPLASGQRVRLSIEAPRDGYLYVIDREQYTDGTLSAPYMIYPGPGNDHKVTAGRVIEIPALEDDGTATWFELQALPREGQTALTAEVLTLLITPEPLPGLKRSDEPWELPAATLAEWEKKWSATAERLELTGGAGRAYTKAEKAAAGAGQPLTTADPMPQTIYRVATRPGNPFMINVSLRIATANPAKNKP
ncbi:MAG: hypothetical protein ACKV2V_02745 [Blastocatellia bacterium]